MQLHGRRTVDMCSAYPCELDLVERQRLGLPLHGRHPPRRLRLVAPRRRRR